MRSNYSMVSDSKGSIQSDIFSGLTVALALVPEAVLTRHQRRIFGSNRGCESMVFAGCGVGWFDGFVGFWAVVAA